MLASKILTLSNRLFKATKSQKYSHYPKAEFRSGQLNNAKLLNNRISLLNYLPKNAIISEIGVNRGDFTEQIINHCSPKKIEIIDFWGSSRYNKDVEKFFYNRFSKEQANGVMSINKGLSTDVIPTFKDDYFDWVYLDTDHGYDVTKAELNLLKNKIKPNGIISGHDYIVGNWNGGVRYGVIEAVREFCLNENWELIFLTTELSIPPSFAIRRI